MTGLIFASFSHHARLVSRFRCSTNTPVRNCSRSAWRRSGSRRPRVRGYLESLRTARALRQSGPVRASCRSDVTILAESRALTLARVRNAQTMQTDRRRPSASRPSPVSRRPTGDPTRSLTGRGHITVDTPSSHYFVAIDRGGTSPRAPRRPPKRGRAGCRWAEIARFPGVRR